MINENFSDVIKTLCRSGQVTILGITGQAGAGKTTRISPLFLEEVRDQGFAAAHLPLDAFFKLSSRNRRDWINAGEAISAEEGAFRSDQINWWDFEAAKSAIKTLRSGQALHLTKVYNRADGGELTGEVHIVPPPTGMVVGLEGVAICHLDNINTLMFVYAPAPVRLERLRQRDKYRQGIEVFERFRVTQSFELQYFPKYWHKITHFIDNSINFPSVLGSLECHFALSEEGIPHCLD